MKRMNCRTPIAAVFAASLTAALAVHAEEDRKLKVVTTLHARASIASDVGGDRVEVKALARAVEDPHEVTATPQRYKELSTADAFIESGFQLEIWDVPEEEGPRRARHFEELFARYGIRFVRSINPDYFYASAPGP